MLRDMDDILSVLYSSAPLTGVSLETLGPGNRVKIRYKRDGFNEVRECVLLGRSSDWYRYRLNVYAIKEGVRWIVCGVHDTCVSVPVWSVSEQKRYDIGETALPFSRLEDRRFRASKQGHWLLVGGVLAGKPEALTILAREDMKRSTRYRIQAKVRAVARLRPGHRFEVA